MMKRGPGLACFDADHTLYCHDAGEAFYRYLIDEKLVPDRFAEYRALEKTDEVRAYCQLATNLAGLEDAHLTALAHTFFSERFRPYPAMQELIRTLLANQWDVRIISAGPRWPIEAAAAHFGLTRQQVVALDVHVENGRVTDRLLFDLPYARGKVQAIDSILKRRPRFAAGDSAADRFMLDTATDTALVIKYPDYSGQAPLLSRAAEAGWLVQEV